VKLLSCLLVLLSVWNSEALAQEREDFRITILEGNNGIIRKDSILQLVVEVRDALNAPVSGAEVTFSAPESGPRILFAGDVTRFTVRTDTQGKASAGPARSTGGDGPFSVTILAESQGNNVTASAQETNQTLAGSTSKVKKKSSRLTWILIAVAGGAAGAALAMKKSSSGPASNGSGGTGAVGTTTVTIGAPTVGAPQ
jgi:hypothetical protein